MKARRTPLKTKWYGAHHPDFMAEKIDDIDFSYLMSLGITTCFIDLDGTVVERGTFEVSDSTKEKLKHSGMRIIIATNRPKSCSLKNLKADMSATAVVHPVGAYSKPLRKYYLRALKTLQLEATETVMIGDRYLQDIWDANRAGLWSLLVYKLGKDRTLPDHLVGKIQKLITNRLVAHYRDV